MSSTVGYIKHEDESCWTHEYSLRHCERYRVDTGDRHVGFVDEVILTPDESEPVALLVRGSAGLVVVSIDQIREFSPRAERIVVDLSSHGETTDAPSPDRSDAVPASAVGV